MAKNSKTMKGAGLGLQQAQATWLAERRIYRTSWTCTKCLIRMNLPKDGWNCTSCKARCEEDRMIARLKLREAEPTSFVMEDEDITHGYLHPSLGGCDTCRYTQGCVEQDGEWISCPSCEAAEAQGKTEQGTHFDTLMVDVFP